VGLAACIVPSGRAHDTLPGAAGAGPARRARAARENTYKHDRSPPVLYSEFSILHIATKIESGVYQSRVDNVR
jgi:hypothetical protein